MTRLDNDVSTFIAVATTLHSIIFPSTTLLGLINRTNLHVVSDLTVEGKRNGSNKYDREQNVSNKRLCPSTW